MYNTSLKRVVLFLLILIGLDQAAGMALRTLYEHTFDGDTAGMINQTLAKQDSDIIVFGSSRVSHHVASPQLSRSLGRRVVNAGVDGQSILYSRALQSELLRRGSLAKVFVLQLDADDVFEPGAGRLAVVTPLAANNETVLALLERGDPYIRIKLLSATYPFNSKVLSVLHNVRRTPAPDQWSPLPASAHLLVATPVQDPPDAATRSVNPAGAAALIAFIKAAQQAKIPVLMFYGPKLRSQGGGVLKRRAQAIFAKLAMQPGVRFTPLDEVSHPRLKPAILYHDSTHLNADGARLLTTLLASELRHMLPAKITE